MEVFREKSGPNRAFKAERGRVVRADQQREERARVGRAAWCG